MNSAVSMLGVNLPHTITLSIPICCGRKFLSFLHLFYFFTTSPHFPLPYCYYHITYTMQFTCTQENLARGLNIVGRVASKNVALPVLQNVLLTAEEGAVRLQTTNLELGVSTTIRAKIDKPGKYTVPARTFSDLVNSLGNDKVTVEASDTGLTITTSHSTTVIKGLPAEDFPVIPELHDGQIATMPGSQLHRALEGVIFSVANDESRPEISGVYVHFEGDAMIVVATDSYRLSERRCKLLQAPQNPKNAIIPARTAQELLRLIPKDDTVATVALGDNQATISIADAEVVTRLIEGHYPDYQQIIPANHTSKVDIDREAFITNVRTASISSQPGVFDLTLDIRASEIGLSSASAQSGNEHHATLEAQVEGKPMSIVFNHHYLLDGLLSLSGETVSLKLTDSQAPGVLLSANQPDDLYLIMPIRQ